ncbi:MAG: hypothetical protein ACE5FO_06810 [Parvularculaceae bacterium]
MPEHEDFLRLAAVLVAAALFGALIAYPEAGPRYVEKTTAAMADAAPERDSLSSKACPIGEAPLSGPFAPTADVLSVSPLGGVTAPGEPLPAPYLRVNTRSGETAFERRVTKALAPARADIIALERRIERDGDGRAAARSWTVYLMPCKDVSIYYDRLDSINDKLLERAGGLAAFNELGGPDHIALETRLRVYAGEAIGTADGFDVGLHDLAAAPTAMARPERYRSNPYARADIFDAPASLISAITRDLSRARCAIDYLPGDLREEWAAKLGDAWGMRRAKGENACRAALADIPGTAQGAWFTDASHNATTSKVSAIALAADSIDPKRLIFALHGRLPSLTPDLIGLAPMLKDERAAAAKDFLTFDIGSGRINRPFSEIRDDRVYCYERLRANFVGPKIYGIILVQQDRAPGGADILRIEARGDALSCIDLPEPWAFTGDETVFYR